MHFSPFEQGRSFKEQFTARRMNDLQRSIPRIRFSGNGARISHLGNQVFIQIPKVFKNIEIFKSDFTIYNTSSENQCAIGVTPGSVTDDISSTVWIPTVDDPIYGVTRIDT